MRTGTLIALTSDEREHRRATKNIIGVVTMYRRSQRVRTLFHSLTGLLLLTAPWTLSTQGQPAWLPALLSLPGAALLAMTWRANARTAQPVEVRAPVVSPRHRRWRKTLAQIREE
jgi:hypothetical protein